MQLNQSLRFCPMCHKDDRIEKVSAVYERETHMSSLVGSGYNVVGISVLGQRLAPPRPPIYKSPWGAGSITVLIIIGLASPGMVVGTLPGYGNSGPSFDVLIATIFWLSIAGAIIWYKLSEASRRRAQVASQIPAYRVAYDNWNRLYYCHRDSTVF